MTSPTGVVVFGASGHGKVVAEIARSRDVSVVAFADDSRHGDGKVVLGIPILSWNDCMRLDGSFGVALGVGHNEARAQIDRRVRECGFSVATLVHLHAVTSPSATIGEGTVVMAGAMINADARIGRGVVVNTGAIVEHDAQIGDFALIGPGTAMGGNVRIGEFTLIGVGARIKPGTTIGSRVIVGAGAVVASDIPDGATVVGVPARPIPNR